MGTTRLAILGVLSLLVWGFAVEECPGEQPHQMEVWLGGPINKIKGHDWPRFDDRKPASITARETPAEVTVHLPGGQRFKSWSKYVYMGQRRATLYKMTLTPLPELAEFPAAVKVAEEAVKRLRLKDREEMLKKIEGWKKGVPEFSVLSKGTLEDRVTLDVEIKPFPPDQRRTWLVNIDFFLHLED